MTCVVDFVQSSSGVSAWLEQMMAASAKSPASVKRRPPLSGEEDVHKNAGWTFLTNHSHVLLSVYRDPDQRLRDVASAVGITERMVHRIIAELVQGGYLKVSKEGRRNRYAVNWRGRLRHPLEKHRTIGELMEMLKAN